MGRCHIYKEMFYDTYIQHAPCLTTQAVLFINADAKRWHACKSHLAQVQVAGGVLKGQMELSPEKNALGASQGPRWGYRYRTKRFKSSH